MKTTNGSLRLRGSRKDELMMNMNRQGQSGSGQSGSGQSARILQFPAGGRRGMAGHRAAADAAELLAQRVSDAVGGAWYHEAAIREDTTPAKT
jgi:hypothetical protein